MSRRTRESSLSDRVIQEPPTVSVVVNAQESSGVAFVEVRPPDKRIGDGSTHSGSPSYSVSTPRKSVTSIVRAEVDSIGAWSDTLSVNVNIAPSRKSSQTNSEEKKSFLGLGKPQSRSGSSTASIYPASPRPGSRGSRRSRRRRGSKEGVTRGDLLMELARHDSVKSRDSRDKSSTSNRDSMRGKTPSKQRKNSDTTSSSSSTSASLATADGVGGAFAKKDRRGFMTALDAVELGERFCGCILKAKFMYYLKPIIFLTFGSILLSGGFVFTVLHFLYEDSLKPPKNQTYFTYGPVCLSTGVILFMVGLVWVPIKEQKWKDGTASPMLAALSQWRLDNLEKEVLQMTHLGEVKTTTSVEKIDETKVDNEPCQTDQSESNEKRNEEVKEEV